MNTLEHAARQIIVDWDSGIHLYEAITTLREALKPNREGKYYYKDNACTADSADSPDCICWHDEALAEQAEQEPVAWSQQRKHNLIKHWAFDCGWDELTEREIDDLELIINAVLYAAPVRTVDLTDDELLAVLKSVDNTTARLPQGFRLFARAVIAAFKEKNLIK